MEFETSRLVVSIIIVVIAIAMGILAILNSRCKGPLFSQAWTMATPEQRATIDKKAEYQGMAVVMGGLAVAFVFIAGYMLWEKLWMFWIAIAAAVVAVVLGMMGGLQRLMKGRKKN